MRPPIEAVITTIESGVQQAQPGFERQYGKLASAFLPHLADVFQLLRRMAFDLALPQRARHRAAAAALYILDPDDFMSSSSTEPHGLVDDVWIAAVALSTLADDLDDDEALARHWRAKTPFEQVLGLARNHSTLEEHVPKRVLDAVKGFLLEA
jgi:uncharacterized membrane protein YkvA (DUF1232 family)